MNDDLIERLLDRTPPTGDPRQGQLLPEQPRLLDVPAARDNGTGGSGVPENAEHSLSLSRRQGSAGSRPAPQGTGR